MHDELTEMQQSDCILQRHCLGLRFVHTGVCTVALRHVEPLDLSLLDLLPWRQSRCHWNRAAPQSGVKEPLKTRLRVAQLYISSRILLIVFV